jgi:hypothetical protein
VWRKCHTLPFHPKQKATIMSAMLYQYAEEKARRLQLRSKTQVGTVNRLLDRSEPQWKPIGKDCGDIIKEMAAWSEWRTTGDPAYATERLWNVLQRQMHQQEF